MRRLFRNSRRAVLNRLAINRIADHRNERGWIWIFGDEHQVPALIFWTNDDTVEASDIVLAPAEAFKHWRAFAGIRLVGLNARRLATVLVCRALAQTHQVEHVDRPLIRQRLESGKLFFCRIDQIAHAGSVRVG
jgi:hypothetical protein